MICLLQVAPISLILDEPHINLAMEHAIVELAPSFEEDNSLEFSIEQHGLCRIAVVRSSQTGRAVKCLIRPELLPVSMVAVKPDTRAYLNVFQIASQMAFPKAITLLNHGHAVTALVAWEWKTGRTFIRTSLDASRRPTRWIARCGRSYFDRQIPATFYERWQRVNNESRGRGDVP